MVEIFDNIRRIYNFDQPCAELADFIEFFSESSVEKTNQFMPVEHFTVKLFPSWTPTIWLNLGSAYHLEINNKYLIVKENEDILLLRDSTVTRHVNQSDHIFTIKFYPGGLESVLGVNQLKLKNKIIKAKDVIPHYLIQMVKQADTYENRIQLLQDYFLLTRHRTQHKRRDYYLNSVKCAIDNYQDEEFLLNTGQVADRLLITSKTINRYFNNIVGINPKKYFSVVRARSALTRHVNSKKNFDPNNFGYHDMSHFYKDISNFIGAGLKHPID